MDSIFLFGVWDKAMDAIFGEEAMKIGLRSDAHGNILGMKTCIDFFYHKKVKKIPWKDDSVTWDIDTPKDLERLNGLLTTSY